MADGVHVLEKGRVAGEGLRLVLAATHAYPKYRQVRNPITGEVEEVEAHYPFWNPLRDVMEDRRIIKIYYDASVPETAYEKYEFYAPSLPAEDRIILILGFLGYSYPSTAISEATDVARSTTGRLLSKLAGENYISSIEDSVGFGPTIIYNGELYRVGRLSETYRVLTDKGYRRFLALIGQPKLVEPPPEEVILPAPVRRPRFAVPIHREKLPVDEGLMVAPKIRVEPLTEEEAKWYMEHPWKQAEEVAERLRSEYFARERKMVEPIAWRPTYRLFTEIEPYEERPLVAAGEECTHLTFIFDPTRNKICLVCGEPVT